MMNTFPVQKPQGRNIKRIHETLGIKQDALTTDFGLNQQTISQVEQKEAIEKTYWKRLPQR